MRRIVFVVFVVLTVALTACPESSPTEPTEIDRKLDDHLHLQPRNTSEQFQPVVLGSGRLEQMPVGDTLFVNGDVQLATAGDYLQLIQNTGTAVAPKITAYAGNPNAYVSGTAGDFLVDASTPALWQCQGGTLWASPQATQINICTVTAFTLDGPPINNWNPSGLDQNGNVCTLANASTFYVTASDNAGTTITGIDALDNSLAQGTQRTICNINATSDDGVIGWTVESGSSSAGNRLSTAWSSGVSWTDTLALHTGDCLTFILEPLNAVLTWIPKDARMRQWRQTVGNLELFPWTTPAPLASGSNTNNWNPADTTPQAAAPGTWEDYSMAIVSTSGSGAATLTGMSHGNGGGNTGKGEGQIKCLWNGGPGEIIVPHESNLSTTGNYFTNPGDIGLKIPVNALYCFQTFGEAWTLIGSPVATEGGISNGCIPVAENLATTDSKSNTFQTSAVCDNATVTTVGAMQVADSATALASTVGASDLRMAPTGTGINVSTAAPPAYHIESTDQRTLNMTTAFTQFGIVSLQDATVSAGGSALTQEAIYADANGCAGGGTCYAFVSQHGNLYFGLGVQSSYMYANTQDLSASGTVESQGNFKVGVSAFGGTAAYEVYASTGHTGTLAPVTGALSSCGTGAPSVSTGSTDRDGTITEGTTATGCVLTFANTYTVSPFCTATATTAIAVGVTTTATTMTLVNASATGDVITYHCEGRNGGT